MRQRKDDVKIGNRQQFALTLLQPGSAGHRLALGAMPVAARIVLNLLVAAVAAPLNVAAQRGGAALGNRTECLTLLARKHRAVARQEARLAVTENVSDFQARFHRLPRFDRGSISAIRLGASWASWRETCVYNAVVLMLPWPSSF